MKKCLVDSGPLVALFNRADKYHKETISLLKKEKIQLYTTWPVITEVSYLLSSNNKIVIDFLTWVYSGGIQLIEITIIDLKRIIALIEKYSDLPTDFADASLVSISEREDIKNIFSFDTDFYVYKRNKDHFNFIWSSSK
ncbi:MAG: PIN domain-containing protein [Spirochaetia bacterium]|nr:PIN domain-containing protein [Spirochaetia bacterium]